MASQFHLALPCLNLQKTIQFYKDMLGAKIGRSDMKWADVNLYSHQITFTECGPFQIACKSYNFNGTILPSFHFGVILPEETWHHMLDHLISKRVTIVSNVKFLEHKIGMHHSFFIKDPNGYTVEFKRFETPSDIFKS